MKIKYILVQMISKKYIFLLPFLVTCIKYEQINVLVEKAVSFSWRPDSKSIVFAVEQPGLYDSLLDYQYYYREVYIKNLDTEEEPILFIGKDTCLFDLDWSPDGNLIAIASRINNISSHIWLFPVDRNSSPQQITTGIFDDWKPSFSPNGRQIAFESNRCGKERTVICVIPTEGGQVKILTEKFPYGSTMAVWHPSGKEIIFTTRHDKTKFDIYSVDLETEEISPLINSFADEYWASYSPNGKYLLFLKYIDNSLSIWIKEVSTSREFQFTNIIPIPISRPRWSPDGQKIAFFTLRKKDTENFKLVYLPFNSEKLRYEDK